VESSSYVEREKEEKHNQARNNVRLYFVVRSLLAIVVVAK